MECKYIALVAVGWRTREWLGFDRSIRNLTSADMGILLVVIQLGVTGLKKTSILYIS